MLFQSLYPNSNCLVLSAAFRNRMSDSLDQLISTTVFLENLLVLLKHQLFQFHSMKLLIKAVLYIQIHLTMYKPLPCHFQELKLDESNKSFILKVNILKDYINSDFKGVILGRYTICDPIYVCFQTKQQQKIVQEKLF